VNPLSSAWNLLLGVLGGLLAFFYQIIPSYGFSIILLTIAVGLVLFPLTLKQTRSMAAMQEIQPQVKRLQKEHKGDREELNKQLMELYKERGVNPAAGCLPLVLQMPIWFALFSVLRTGNGIPRDSDLWAVVEPA
jgi:YidC/Oxa1 family membrane protein insertase